MAKLPEIGKISTEAFNELIFPHLGAHREEVLVGPRHGVDVAIVRIGNKAVAMTSDPVFIVPEYGFAKAAWFATHILASDVVTSGLAPTYLTIDLNLPVSMTEDELALVWNTIDTECKKMSMAIVCGHTGRYENCHYPMVGGATVLAVGEMDRYVSPGFAKKGDQIIITKGPAIEASGIFATMFPKYLTKHFGEPFAVAAQEIFYKMSVVDDALTAITVGVRDEGISAMHDATECGVWGGLYEIASAAGLGARVDKSKIPVDDRCRRICELFKIDPYASISEGTLIITCRAHKADAAVKALAEKNIGASIVGELTGPEKGIVLIEGGQERALEHPRVDPFWPAFYTALRNYQDMES